MNVLVCFPFDETSQLLLAPGPSQVTPGPAQRGKELRADLRRYDIKRGKWEKFCFFSFGYKRGPDNGALFSVTLNFVVLPGADGQEATGARKLVRT